MLVTKGALGHIVLNVADLKKSERFYTSLLGLKVSARNLHTRMTFLSYGREHHDIALQALPKGAKHVSGEGMAKLHHFCIYVDRNEIIDEIQPILKRRKISIVSGPETLVVAGNRSISFLDPDGNRVEIACNANKFKFDNRSKPASPRRNLRKRREITTKLVLSECEGTGAAQGSQSRGAIHRALGDKTKNCLTAKYAKKK